MFTRLALLSTLLLVAASAGQSAVPATAPAPSPATATAPATAGRPGSQPAAAAKDLTLTANDNGKSVKLGDNTGVAISLVGNPTTGYSWNVTKIDGDAVVQQGDVQYVADKAPQGMVGSGGVFVARFRPVKTGQATLTLGYTRPWEKDTPPAKTFTVTIVVDKVPVP